MKKARLLVLLLLLSLLLPGCAADEGYSLESVGKEAFEHYNGEYELDVYLLPGEDFPSLYPAETEYYHFIARYRHRWSVTAPESLLVLLRYEPSVYAEAKQYCFEQMKLRDIGLPVCRDTCFLENTALPEALGRSGDDGSATGFPTQFNLFAYNDRENTLAFMGHYSDVYASGDKNKVIEDWEGFLRANFPEIADIGE